MWASSGAAPPADDSAASSLLFLSSAAPAPGAPSAAEKRRLRSADKESRPRKKPRQQQPRGAALPAPEPVPAAPPPQPHGPSQGKNYVRVPSKKFNLMLARARRGETAGAREATPSAVVALEMPARPETLPPDRVLLVPSVHTRSKWFGDGSRTVFGQKHGHRGGHYDFDFDFDLSRPVSVSSFVDMAFGARLVLVHNQGQVEQIQFPGAKTGGEATPAVASVMAEVAADGRVVGLRLRFMSNRNGVAVKAVRRACFELQSAGGTLFRSRPATKIRAFPREGDREQELRALDETAALKRTAQRAGFSSSSSSSASSSFAPRPAAAAAAAAAASAPPGSAGWRESDLHAALALQHVASSGLVPGSAAMPAGAHPSPAPSASPPRVPPLAPDLPVEGELVPPARPWLRGSRLQSADTVARFLGAAPAPGLLSALNVHGVRKIGKRSLVRHVLGRQQAGAFFTVWVDHRRRESQLAQLAAKYSPGGDAVAAFRAVAAAVPHARTVLVVHGIEHEDSPAAVAEYFRLPATRVVLCSTARLSCGMCPSMQYWSLRGLSDTGARLLLEASGLGEEHCAAAGEEAARRLLADAEAAAAELSHHPFAILRAAEAVAARSRAQPSAGAGAAVGALVTALRGHARLPFLAGHDSYGRLLADSLYQVLMRRGAEAQVWRRLCVLETVAFAGREDIPVSFCVRLSMAVPELATLGRGAVTAAVERLLDAMAARGIVTLSDGDSGNRSPTPAPSTPASEMPPPSPRSDATFSVGRLDQLVLRRNIEDRSAGSSPAASAADVAARSAAPDPGLDALQRHERELRAEMQEAERERFGVFALYGSNCAQGIVERLVGGFLEQFDVFAYGHNRAAFDRLYPHALELSRNCAGATLQTAMDAPPRRLAELRYQVGRFARARGERRTAEAELDGALRALADAVGHEDFEDRARTTPRQRLLYAQVVVARAGVLKEARRADEAWSGAQAAVRVLDADLAAGRSASLRGALFCALGNALRCGASVALLRKAGPAEQARFVRRLFALHEEHERWARGRGTAEQRRLDAELARSLHCRARAALVAGEFAKAQADARRALEIKRRVFHRDDGGLRVTEYLARAVQQRGRSQWSEELVREVEADLARPAGALPDAARVPMLNQLAVHLLQTAGETADALASVASAERHLATARKLVARQDDPGNRMLGDVGAVLELNSATAGLCGALLAPPAERHARLERAADIMGRCAAREDPGALHDVRGAACHELGLLACARGLYDEALRWFAAARRGAGAGDAAAEARPAGAAPLVSDCFTFRTEYHEAVATLLRRGEGDADKARRKLQALAAMNSSASHLRRTAKAALRLARQDKPGFDEFPALHECVSLVGLLT